MHTAPARLVNDTTFSALASGITLMQASFTDHAFERHSHDGFAIGVTTAGVQRFRCKGAQYDSQVGDLVLFNRMKTMMAAPAAPTVSAMRSGMYRMR